MSIENFLRQNVPGQEFAARFGEWNREGNPGFRVLAEKFIEQGKVGLKRLSLEVDSRYKFASDERQINIMRARGKEDAAAIVFGETMFALEQAAIDRSIDTMVYANSINRHFVGTRYPDVELLSAEKEEIIPPEQAGLMLGVLIKEKNPSSILSRNNRDDMLPARVFYLLENEGFFPQLDILVAKFQALLNATGVKP